MGVKQEAPQDTTFTAEEVAALQEQFRSYFKVQRLARMGLADAEQLLVEVVPILNTVGQKIGVILREGEQDNGEPDVECNCPVCQLERAMGLK